MFLYIAQTNIKKASLYPLLILAITGGMFAQEVELPANHSLVHKQERYFVKSNYTKPQSIKPLLVNINDTLGSQNLWSGNETGSAWTNAFFCTKPARVFKPGFSMLVSPLANFEYSDTLSGFSQMFVNTRGIRIEGTIGDKVSYITDFYENQAYLLGAENEFALKYMVMPGQGATKIFNENGHDFSSASGRIYIKPTDNLRISTGNGKHFIGQGYRSLLLSDNAFNYPFLRADVQFGKFSYTAMLLRLEEFYYKYYAQHTRKHATVLHLSYVPVPQLEISLFEGIIWETSDSVQTNQMPIAMLIPVPGVRMLGNSLLPKMNPNIGLDFRLSPHNLVQLYGQLLLDDLQCETPKYGAQAGIKLFDIFVGFLPKTNWYWQAELNILSQGTGLNQSKYQNYTHYNQPLAHPAGTGLNEKLLLTELEVWRFYLKAQISVINAAPDTPILAATNMYFIKNTETNTNTVIAPTTYKAAEIGIIINPAYNLRLALGTRRRAHPVSGSLNYTYFSIKTSLRNIYHDF